MYVFSRKNQLPNKTGLWLDQALEQAAQEVVESPSLEVFKKRVDKALQDMV